MPSSIVRAQLRSTVGPGFGQMSSVAIPPKSRRAVSGFPPLTDAVGGLPSREQIELRMLVEWVIETHMPGAFPVIGISCIGHADRDDERGRAFELDMEEKREREKRTLDPPGDPDEPDEETEAPPTRQRDRPLQQLR
jgi:hypothetical protein